MSNRKSGENPDRRKPKVSLAMFVNQGLGGPKSCPSDKEILSTNFKILNSCELKSLEFRIYNLGFPRP